MGHLKITVKQKMYFHGPKHPPGKKGDQKKMTG